VLGIIWYTNNNSSVKSKGEPLEELKQRFVRGEISEEEYLRMKKMII
jgi:uncharacterized membrane protein